MNCSPGCRGCAGSVPSLVGLERGSGRRRRGEFFNEGVTGEGDAGGLSPAWKTGATAAAGSGAVVGDGEVAYGAGAGVSTPCGEGG